MLDNTQVANITAHELRRTFHKSRSRVQMGPDVDLDRSRLIGARLLWPGS